MGIADIYVAELVDPSLHPIFDDIVAEHTLTLREVLRLTGSSTLLARHPVLRNTLSVRASYLEPLHHLQVELLAAEVRGTRCGPAPRPAAHDQRHRCGAAQHRLTFGFAQPAVAAGRAGDQSRVHRVRRGAGHLGLPGRAAGRGQRRARPAPGCSAASRNAAPVFARGRAGGGS